MQGSRDAMSGNDQEKMPRENEDDHLMPKEASQRISMRQLFTQHATLVSLDSHDTAAWNEWVDLTPDFHTIACIYMFSPGRKCSSATFNSCC